MTRVYASIGSNQQPHEHIRRALAALERQFRPLEVSPVYESVAVGFSGDNFLNLVVAFDTDLPLEQLDQELRRIEDDCGRVRGSARFTSRTMDIDLLTYGDLVRHDGHWDLPRDEIGRYAFVLRPLVDIAADARHPELGITFGELWHRLDLSGQALWPLPAKATS